jgi:hypothetical protein
MGNRSGDGIAAVEFPWRVLARIAVKIESTYVRALVRIEFEGQIIHTMKSWVKNILVRSGFLLFALRCHIGWPVA